MTALSACTVGLAADPVEGTGDLSVLVGRAHDAETAEVERAVLAWSANSGTGAEVSVAADLSQELSRGIAAGDPPDVFEVGADHFPGYAASGSLLPYGDQLAAIDSFYPTLTRSFTYEHEVYCAPKDFSTLALVINTDLWTEAGLTDADHPTTWDELSEVADRLTTKDVAGLSISPEWERIGVFMAQAGGHLVDEDLSADVDTPENAEALTFVKGLLADGSLNYPAELGAGWGGEAFGLGAAAMTIEGNWVVGSLAEDYPDVRYTVVPLPEGPAGPATLQFTDCWAVAADSGNQDAAVELVEFLTSGEQQMRFAQELGTMPSASAVAEEWAGEFPEQEAFLRSADHAQGYPPVDGVADLIRDFNAQLEGLESGDPQRILASVQASLEAVEP